MIPGLKQERLNVKPLNADLVWGNNSKAETLIKHYKQEQTLNAYKKWNPENKVNSHFGRKSSDEGNISIHINNNL